MRYLVTALLKPGKAAELRAAVDAGTLGQGSVAGDEYLRNVANARACDDGRVRWVEVCFCPTPLLEEREYWEEFFVLEKVQDAHARVAMPRPDRHRTMGLLRLRLQRAPRSSSCDQGTTVYFNVLTSNF